MAKTGTGYNLGDIFYCPVCGKKFWIPAYSNWVYRRNMQTETGSYGKIPLCSWGCVSAFDKAKIKEKEERLKEKRAAREKALAALPEAEQEVARRKGQGHPICWDSYFIPHVVEVIKSVGADGATNNQICELLKEKYGDEYETSFVGRKLNGIAGRDLGGYRIEKGELKTRENGVLRCRRLWLYIEEYKGFDTSLRLSLMSG